MSDIMNQAGFIAAVDAAGKASDNIVVDYFEFVRNGAEVTAIDATDAAPLAALTDEIATLLASAPLSEGDTMLLREKCVDLVRAAHGKPKFPTTASEVVTMLSASDDYAGQADVLLTNRNAIENAIEGYPASVIESWLPDTQ